MYEERAPKTASAARTVELLPETVRLLRAIQPLRVEPGSHVFLSTDAKPIEPKSLSAHWYACLRALGIRVRGIYSAKDTYMSTALTAGVNTAWLEHQTGVAYATIRKHYGRWLRAEGESQTQKIAAFAGQVVPQFVPQSDDDEENVDTAEGWKCEEGDLNPLRCRDSTGESRVRVCKRGHLDAPVFPSFPVGLPQMRRVTRTTHRWAVGRAEAVRSLNRQSSSTVACRAATAAREMAILRDCWLARPDSGARMSAGIANGAAVSDRGVS